MGPTGGGDVSDLECSCSGCAGGGRVSDKSLRSLAECPVIICPCHSSDHTGAYVHAMSSVHPQSGCESTPAFSPQNRRCECIAGCEDTR